MRWLIRRVIKKGKGSVSYEEDVHFGDVLTIGRGSDQAIFIPDLRVALDHAKVTALGNGQYKIESLILAGIRVNNDITYATTVGPGAIVEIGTTRIQLLEPPVDHDAGVEVSTIDKAELKALKDAKALPTSLAQTWLSKRRPSWIVFTLVALLFVGLPLAAHFTPTFRKVLHDIPGVPSQDQWQAGDLAPAHHYFGSECTTCHQVPFRWVKDEACAKCHAGTPAHADPVKFNLPELGDARCAHCHRDHNGPNGLVIQDQVLCADCHHDLKARTKNASALVDVGDFAAQHPEFQIDLPAWDANGNFKPVRTLLSQPGIKEASGLKYPHDVHLDPKGIKSPNGNRILTCDSCHKPEPGGARIMPVDYETMCQECHRLDFDVLEPGRQVPHGKIAEILYMLDEFYSKRALEGGYMDLQAPIVVQQRRRPGQAMSREETIEAQTWAREKSRKVGDALFNGRACTVCHTVTAGTGGADTWRIAPVRVQGEWFSKAHFTHAKHKSEMTCESCHPATASKAATDLLMPGIENCRQCHGGENDAGKVPSTCISCHGYHESDKLLLQVAAPALAPPPAAAPPSATAPAPAATPTATPASQP